MLFFYVKWTVVGPSGRRGHCARSPAVIKLKRETDRARCRVTEAAIVREWERRRENAAPTRLVQVRIEKSPSLSAQETLFFLQLTAVGRTGVLGARARGRAVQTPCELKRERARFPFRRTEENLAANRAVTKKIVPTSKPVLVCRPPSRNLNSKRSFSHSAEWGLWGEWLACPETCGLALRARRRSCVNPETNATVSRALCLALDGTYVDSGQCNLAACPSKAVILLL